MCTVDIDKRQNTRLNLTLFRHEFLLVTPALEDFLGVISLDASAAVFNYISVPYALVVMCDGHEVLMKPLTMFITNSPRVTGEVIKETMKEMQLDTHFTPKIAISLQHCMNRTW